MIYVRNWWVFANRVTYKDSRENFRGALENCEKPESLAQRIFPRLRCTVICIITKQVP